MQSNLPVFELKGVSYSYDKKAKVLDNMSLTINSCERICILGANGSGKSTLQKIFCGLIYPDEGDFFAFGKKAMQNDFDNSVFSKEYHRKIGFIFQNSDAQLFCSTVKEEIAFGPLQMGFKKAEVESRVHEMMDMLGLAGLAERPPYKLSGGEKKKVALASILVMDPEVLILDEPTNALDPKTQRWLVHLLNELGSQGKSIITATHNLELVQEISDRVIVFSQQHKICADGKTNDILANTSLLIESNLVDEYYHRHEGSSGHGHYHIHNY